MLSSTKTREEKAVFTNPHGYAEIEVDTFEPIGDRIVIQWEEANDKIKVGQFHLERPETHKGQHYTGIILSRGLFVDSDLKPGVRIFFEQFAGFEKLFDPKYGRIAIIKESDAKAIVPPRVKVESMSGDYNYEA